MKGDNSKNQASLFYSLNYEERLKFWDDNNFTFHYDKNEIDGVIVTIEPETIAERLLYNKWLIDHWKYMYLNDGFGDKVGLNTILYKTYDVYVKQFSDRINGLSIESKRKITNEEIFAILDTISRTGIKKNLAKDLLAKFLINKEADVYYYKSDVSSSLIDLRHIAQVWEMMMYYSYLKKQKKNLGKPKKTDELKPVKLILLLDHQIRFIYDYLVSESFIDNQTKYKNFKYALLQNHEKLKSKILWLDVNDNHSSDKTTLLFFGDAVVLGGMKDNIGEVYRFLSTYFETYVYNQVMDVKSSTLKQSKQLIDFENLKQRQQQINSFFEHIK